MQLLFHKPYRHTAKLFVSERKQIALFRHGKFLEISRTVFHDKPLRNEVYYETEIFYLQRMW